MTVKWKAPLELDIKGSSTEDFPALVAEALEIASKTLASEIQDSRQSLQFQLVSFEAELEALKASLAEKEPAQVLSKRILGLFSDLVVNLELESVDKYLDLVSTLHGLKPKNIASNYQEIASRIGIKGAVDA